MYFSTYQRFGWTLYLSSISTTEATPWTTTLHLTINTAWTTHPQSSDFPYSSEVTCTIYKVCLTTFTTVPFLTLLCLNLRTQACFSDVSRLAPPLKANNIPGLTQRNCVFETWCRTFFTDISLHLLGSLAPVLHRHLWCADDNDFSSSAILGSTFVVLGDISWQVLGELP